VYGVHVVAREGKIGVQEVIEGKKILKGSGDGRGKGGRGEGGGGGEAEEGVKRGLPVGGALMPNIFCSNTDHV